MVASHSPTASPGSCSHLISDGLFELAGQLVPPVGQLLVAAAVLGGRTERHLVQAHRVAVTIALFSA